MKTGASLKDFSIPVSLRGLGFCVLGSLSELIVMVFSNFSLESDTIMIPSSSEVSESLGSYKGLVTRFLGSEVDGWDLFVLG